MLLEPMNFENSDDPSGDGRRAAHVKWDGKTIALGTFPAQEAAEKCDRAKALTKKWRTTMIPKPDVEWVKSTLERLNIRVVNDRPGRRKKRDISELEQQRSARSGSSHQGAYDLAQSRSMNMNMNMNMNSLSRDSYSAAGQGAFAQMPPTSSYSSNMASERQFSDSSQYGFRAPQRRLSNPPLSTLSNPTNSFNMMDNTVCQAGYQPSINDHPLLRNTGDLNAAGQGHDHYSMGQNAFSGGQQRSTSLGHGPSSTQQQLSGLVFGSERHYEALKDHHLSLLKELQETTTLMNMYHAGSDQLGMNFGLGRNQPNFDPYADIGNNPFMNQATGQNQASSFDQNWRMGQSQMFSPKLNSHSLGHGENINLARRDSQRLPQASPPGQYSNVTNRNTMGSGSTNNYPLSDVQQRSMAQALQSGNVGDLPNRAGKRTKDSMTDRDDDRIKQSS